ncbi:RNA editing complex protein MP46, putative [Bodo saltans]|uniref:RNA editing complex protein MP46, putative n=1 Tax=Bodo saltans TaxID=75058 RepID=A0A0S4IPF4_BODSA|nr:RNA editing complex protein MP46, putative [Bodo saltans]|eukprot:CUE73248.1 RNA editing complex protein MP46, putative [Bodo saltans]
MRRLLSQSITHASIVGAASVRHCAVKCLLCDTSHSDWNGHLNTHAHVARHVVCATLVVPNRHEVMMKQLWDHIHLDFQQLDEVAAKKEARRRGRLTSSMEYLKEQHVILQSLVHTSNEADTNASADVDAATSPPELCVSPRFNSLVALGTTYAQKEVLDRVARLLPDAEGNETIAVAEYVLSQRNVVHVFKVLRIETLMADVPLKELKSDMRAAVVLAMLGELQLFSRQPRSRNVSDPATADLLVLNVLATHVLDNVLSELTHMVLQKVVDEGTPVWTAYQEQLAMEKRFLRKVPPLQLSSSPTSEVVPGEDAWDACKSLGALSKSPGPMSPMIRWRPIMSDAIRAGSLDVSVPGSPFKNSAYAACLPRLGKKRAV